MSRRTGRSASSLASGNAPTVRRSRTDHRRRPPRAADIHSALVDHRLSRVSHGDTPRQKRFDVDVNCTSPSAQLGAAPPPRPAPPTKTLTGSPPLDVGNCDSDSSGASLAAPRAPKPAGSRPPSLAPHASRRSIEPGPASMPHVVLSPTPGETLEFVPEESEISVRAGERSRRGSMRPAVFSAGQRDWRRAGSADGRAEPVIADRPDAGWT